VQIPEALARLRATDAGQQWLSSLARRVDDCVARWDLRIGAPFPSAFTSLTIPARLRDGTDAVLKIPFPDRESEHEALALSHWNGDGAIRLLEDEPALGAFLIERCVPGTPLSGVGQDLALDILSSLLPRLWKPAQAPPFRTLTDEASRLLGGKGEFAIITGALSAANQNEWIAFIKKRLADRHLDLKLATIRPSDDDRDKAFAETQTIMKVYPTVKLIMAISAPAVPGAAEAVRQAGRRDVDVIGLSLPNINKPYVHSGVVQTVVLWNTRDLGYLTVYAGALAAGGGLAAGAHSVQAGRLGAIEIRGSEIVLGPPLLFNKSNIDRFDF